MKKEYKIFMIPLITIASYIFCDDPNPDPEFMKLSFVGRMKHYYGQIVQDGKENDNDKG